MVAGPATFRVVADATVMERLRESAGAFFLDEGGSPGPRPTLRFGVGGAGGRILLHNGATEGRYLPLPDGGLAFWDGDVVVGLRLALARHFPPPRWLQCHAAGLRFPGGCVVALGRSGAGKSTLATHAGGELLSDEMVLVDTDRRHAWGLPIRSSSPRAPAPLDGPIRAFVTLRHASAPSLRPLRPDELCGALLESLAATPEARLEDQLDAAVRLAEATRAFELSFAPEPSAGGLLEQLCAS